MSLLQVNGQSTPEEKAAKDRASKAYIEKFREDAVKEMYLHHIPASIVLAQAMFESDNGLSELARNASNHFGIKCKKEWGGDSYLKDDDELKECFRKYTNVLDSYSDHSLFLMSRPRYAFLFQLPLNDYKAWCLGLKEAGYATDPMYAIRLITIIEQYKLYELDKHYSLPATKPDYVFQKKEQSPELAMREVYRFNHIKFIITKPGDSYFKIAMQFNIELEKLLGYNDIQRGEKIEAGQKLFLEPKRERAKEPYHLVQKGEDLKAISQIHGIRLSALCRNNRLSPSDSLKTGEILYLRGKKPKETPEPIPAPEEPAGGISGVLEPLLR